MGIKDTVQLMETQIPYSLIHGFNLEALAEGDEEMVTPRERVRIWIPELRGGVWGDDGYFCGYKGSNRTLKDEEGFGKWE